MDERRLKELPLFVGLGRAERKHVAPMVDEVELPSGREIVREGEIAHELFVIEEGTASVSQGGEPIGELGPGDFFGEIALFDEGRRRSSTVVATAPMRLAVLHSKHVRQLDRELPAVSRQLRSVVEERLAADAARRGADEQR